MSVSGMVDEVESEPFEAADEQQQEQHEYAGPERLAPFAWKKGQSGNPNGRPPGRVSLKAVLQEMLAEELKAGVREAHLLVRSMLEACKDDPKKTAQLHALIWAYNDGPPGMQQVEQEERKVEIVLTEDAKKGLSAKRIEAIEGPKEESDGEEEA